MKQKFIIILTTFFLFFNLYAQSDYRNGYVITNNRDTLYGLIGYKGNKANAKKCFFKKEAKAEKIDYSPDQIIAYRFTDSKYYVSKSIKTKDGEELLFLEYLIDGVVDIYYYRDQIGEHYFIDGGDGRLTELPNEQKEIIINNQRYFQKNTKYLGILKLAFNKSLEIVEKVDKVSLDHKSLIEIANDYHNAVCRDTACIIYEKKLPVIKIVFGPVLGINMLSFSFKENFSDDLYYLNNSDFKEIIYPAFGFLLKANMPYLNERIYFKYETMYHRWAKETTTILTDFTFDLTYTNNITLRQNALNNSLLIQYEFPGVKIRPVLQAGGYFNYYFMTDFHRQLNVTWSSGATHYSDEYNDNPFSRFDVGLSVGTGIIVNLSTRRRLYLDLRYHQGIARIQHTNSSARLFIFNISFPINE